MNLPSNVEQFEQLFDDMLPYYSRIAVYDPDKAFISNHKEQCLRIVLAGKEAILAHCDIKPEDAIFSDELFSSLISYAWQNLFNETDRLFLNQNLRQAAECFRMGFMMADLPEMN